MWQKVARCPNGHVDGRMMLIGAERRGLGGFTLVRAGKDNKLMAVDGSSVPVKRGQPMALHLPRSGHWAPLIELVRLAVIIYRRRRAKK